MARPTVSQEALPRQTRVPRYRNLYEALRQDITSGALPVGEKLPSEDDLCRKYEVSRHTVRSAMRDLAEDGMIASRQGSRSVVLTQSPASVYTTSVSSLDELLQYVTEVNYEVAKSGIVAADKALAERLGAQAGQRWLRVEGIRSRQPQATPVCWTEVFVHSDYAGIGLLIGRRPGTIYSWIEEMYGVRIEEVRQVLRVEPMGAKAAAALGYATGSMAVLIRRSYVLEDGTLVEVAFNQHPVDRFQYEMTLRKRANRALTYSNKLASLFSGWRHKEGAGSWGAHRPWHNAPWHKSWRGFAPGTASSKRSGCPAVAAAWT